MSAFSPPHPQLGVGPGAALPRGRRARHRGSGWGRLRRLGKDPKTVRVATVALLAVLVAALLAEVPGLTGVAQRIEHISPGWIAVAIALELASAISFVVLFRLFFDRLDGRDGRALAWTSQGSGALLPGGGAGGLAIGAALTRLAGAPTHWIVRRSAGLFFLSAGVSGVALIGSGIALLAGAAGPHDFLRVVVPTSAAAIATVSIAALPVILGSGARGPRWLRVLTDRRARGRA